MSDYTHNEKIKLAANATANTAVGFLLTAFGTVLWTFLTRDKEAVLKSSLGSFEFQMFFLVFLVLAYGFARINFQLLDHLKESKADNDDK
jgi:hypothetical protein